MAKSENKPGYDYDQVVQLYQEIVKRFPKTELAHWASIWLKTQSNGNLGKLAQYGLPEKNQIPSDYKLFANYPNPFNPETTVEYALPEESRVLIQVYNVLGQKITTLLDADMQKGYHIVKWNGRNTAGQKVGAGIYLCRMQADDFVKTQKMTLLP